MSTTVAHRSHVHHRLPWLTIVVLVAAIAIAAVVIYAVNQPTTTGTTVEPVVQPAAPAMAIPEPDNYAFIRQMILQAQMGGIPAYRAGMHNFIVGM